jgi:hypothetical protein
MVGSMAASPSTTLAVLAKSVKSHWALARLLWNKEPKNTANATIAILDMGTEVTPAS